MLKKRIITATILISFFVLALFYLPMVYFASITAVICVLAGFEWTRLAGFTRFWSRIAGLLGMIALGLVLAWRLDLNLSRTAFLNLAWGLCVFWIAAGFIVYAYPKFSKVLHTRWLGLGAGICVLWPAWLALMILYLQGPIYVLYVFILIWSADIGAYFVGKRFGKHKLAPLVSPGKTWEGVLGALCTTLVVAGLGFILITPFHHNLGLWLLLSIITVLFSIIGDLFESVFKRIRNLKDSGSLLPGHGGVLDRIDSLTAALPIFLAGNLIG